MACVQRESLVLLKFLNPVADFFLALSLFCLAGAVGQRCCWTEKTESVPNGEPQRKSEVGSAWLLIKVLKIDCFTLPQFIFINDKYKSKPTKRKKSA
jgi:hypothetical protein